jgi:hypothetical protein
MPSPLTTGIRRNRLSVRDSLSVRTSRNSVRSLGSPRMSLAFGRKFRFRRSAVHSASPGTTARPSVRLFGSRSWSAAMRVHFMICPYSICPLQPIWDLWGGSLQIRTASPARALILPRRSQVRRGAARRRKRSFPIGSGRSAAVGVVHRCSGELCQTPQPTSAPVGGQPHGTIGVAHCLICGAKRRG